MKNINFGILLVLASALLLASCGGGGGGGSATTAATPVNIALPANGGTATSAVNGASAFYLNDGVTMTANYWTGSATNDTITVTFNKAYAVSDFTLYLNFTNTTDTRFEVSTDGTNYTNLTLISSCSNLSLGSG